MLRYHQKLRLRYAPATSHVTDKAQTTGSVLYDDDDDDNHHHHLPPWVRSIDLFRHRRVAIVSWGVRDRFFLEVCS